MMFRIRITIAAFLAAAISVSCRTADPYAHLASEEVSIARLKEIYKGSPVRIDKNLVITGTVVSSDQFGNFYKTMVVEDATAGIEVKVDMERIFSVYLTGSRVKIYCRSLTLGAYGGLVQLGSDSGDGYEAGFIGSEEVPKHILNAGLPEDSHRPLTLGLDRLTIENASGILCRKVAFRHVRFAETGEGITWCEPGIDTDRVLADGNGNTIVVRTSRYARFASIPLPEGDLYIEGILSWFNGKYQLRVINETAADPL